MKDTEKQDDEKGCLHMVINSNGGIVIETTDGPIEISFVNKAKITILADKKIKIFRQEVYRYKGARLDG